MNARFSLLLVLAVLVGGGLYLLLQPRTEPVVEAPASVPTAQPDSAPAERRTPPTRSSRPSFHVLAVSWQPAFCETAENRPECRAQGRDSFEASHFTLHGLWPQGEYCDLPEVIAETDRRNRWSELPAPELSRTLRAELDIAMPGTRSRLERHEWAKHGSCFDGDAETYFATALNLLEQLNSSGVRDLFADTVGRRLTQSRIRDAFDAAFGSGVGERVRVACEDDGNRTLINELTLGLWGMPDERSDLGELLDAARPTGGGCSGGIVDAVGLQ